LMNHQRMTAGAQKRGFIAYDRDSRLASKRKSGRPSIFA
jgi:hypothetical protein